MLVGRTINDRLVYIPEHQIISYERVYRKTLPEGQRPVIRVTLTNGQVFNFQTIEYEPYTYIQHALERLLTTPTFEKELKNAEFN